MNKNYVPEITLTYFALALIIFASAFFPQPQAFTPIFMSVLLLIPIYLWYKNYSDKEKLSKETIKKDKSATFFWIFILFILALSVRIPSALIFGMPYEKTPLIYLIILTIILIEKTDISAFGFKTENIEKSLLYGLAFFIVLSGVLSLSFNLLIFVFTNQISIASFSIIFFFLVMPFHTLCVGISEEGLFRGYMQTHLQKFYTPTNAILIQASLFGIWHFVWDLRPFNPIGMAQYIAITFLIGLLFGYFYSKSKNIVPLIFAHGLYNSFIQGIIKSETAAEAFKAIPIASQIMAGLLPYAISAITTFLFIKYVVKEI